MSRPTRILLVGRPNVGKSSLMNALLGYRRAIVLDEAGTTRDRVAEPVVWEDRAFELVDAQGIEGERDEALLRVILDDADLLLFVVDVRSGVLPDDRWLAREIKRSGKKALLCLNKAESRDQEDALAFAELGFEEEELVSASHRVNLDSLKAWCVRHGGIDPQQTSVRKLAIVGRPNVGKSTLLNRLCGAELAVVSPVAHTTRDPVRGEVREGNERFVILDTAGIRRRRNRNEAIETFSIQAAERAIREADAVLLLLDVTDPLTEQDRRMIGLVEEMGKPTAIVLNQCDRLPSTEVKRVSREIRRFAVAQPFPHVPISAATGENVRETLRVASELIRGSETRIPTARLNERMQEILARNPPPARGEGHFNLMYVSQIRTAPPTFVFFGNRRRAVTRAYERYLRNAIRKEFGFKGQPIRLYFRENRDSR